MKHYSNKILIIIITAAIVSCVPNKKIAYLQYKNEFREPETIVKDSLIRKYRTGEFNYRLQPNDLLDIKISTMTPLLYNPFADADRSLIPGQIVYQTADPERQVQPTGYYIEPDGSVNLPIVGKITIAGYTFSQAEDTLESYVKKYLEKPVVRIKLQNFRFSVIGEVNKEATLTTGDNTLTLLQAIAMAGGPSEFADRSRIKILRHYGNETFVFYVNLLSEEYLTSPFYFVQPQDVIVIAPVKQRSYLKYAAPNLAVLTTGVSLILTLIYLLRL